MKPFKDLAPQTSINLRADCYGRIALSLSRLAAMTTRCELDVAYGEAPHRRLDVYLPDERRKGPFPVFVYLHGGGLMWGYKEWMGLNAPAITNFPAIFISVEYQLAPEGPKSSDAIPDQLDDAAAAVAWIHQNVARYGGDPDRIHIGGHSAGAFLTSLLTVRPDVQRKHGIADGVIKSCFPVSGGYDSRDPTIYGGEAKKARVPAGSSMADAISAITHVSETKTPFFITWAENDNRTVITGGPAMILALRGAGVRAEGHMFELFDHFWVHLDQQRETNLWTRTLRSWMLGDPRTAPVAA